MCCVDILQHLFECTFFHRYVVFAYEKCLIASLCRKKILLFLRYFLNFLLFFQIAQINLGSVHRRVNHRYFASSHVLQGRAVRVVLFLDLGRCEEFRHVLRVVQTQLRILIFVVVFFENFLFERTDFLSFFVLGFWVEGGVVDHGAVR